MDSFFCQYCGTPNNADARFCKVCGRQFNAAPQSPPLQQSGYLQQPLSPQHPQQPNIPLQPVAVAAPPKKKKIKILVIGLIPGLVGVCAVFFGYALIFMQPIQNTANDFLTAMENQNYAKAYSMFGQDLQEDLGNPDALKTFMESNGLEFSAYKSGEVKRSSDDPPQAIKMAEVTLLDGSTTSVEVDMQVGPDDVWQVIGFFFPEK